MLKIKLEDIPFNLDPWDCELDEDVIENITSGDYFIEYVKNNPKPFQITFAAFVNAKEYFLYAWDGEVLIAGNVEHGTLYEDFEEIPMEEYDEKWREITQSEEIPDELIEEMDQPGLGLVRQPRPAARFSDTPAKIQGVAPMLGEHTREILKGHGISNDQADDLFEKGIVR